MAKGEGFQGSVQTVCKNRRSPCNTRRHRPTTKSSSPSHNLVWVPKIPSWEKEFCYKIGLFEWEDFVEAKKLIGSFGHSKILEWNDEAAEEAFYRAKAIFRARINGVIINLADEFNPDSYIDEIVWDDDDDDKILDGLELAAGGDQSVSDGEEDDEEEEEEEANLDGDEYVPDYYHIRIEDIKPTGWDIDVDEISGGKVLTGLIVGSDD